MCGIIGLANVAYLWNHDGISVDFPTKSKVPSSSIYFALAGNLQFDPKELHSMLTERYKLHLIPGYNVCIDEIRIPCTHEECKYKQHNQQKPDVWAIESKSLHADNGYLLDFIYPIDDAKPSPREAFFQFADWLKTTTRSHHLVADSNFLDATDLLRLWDYSFEGTISCKSTRPSYLWKKGLVQNLPESYTRVASSKRLCAAAVYNNGVAKLATTRCVAKSQDSSSNVKERRSILTEYDKFKGAADRFGQLYKTTWPRGCHKNWEVTLLEGWFFFTLTNAYILYHMRFDNLSHHEFVREIADAYLNYEEK